MSDHYTFNNGYGSTVFDKTRQMPWIKNKWWKTTQTRRCLYSDCFFSNNLVVLPIALTKRALSICVAMKMEVGLHHGDRPILIFPHSAASDLGLHCSPLSHKKDARLTWVTDLCSKQFELHR